MTGRKDSGVFYGSPATSSDRLFVYFMRLVVLIFLLYGLGMTVVILWGNPALGGKMLNVFAAMFTGVIGLGSGYLLGKRNGG